jgi:hypothetical protein
VELSAILLARALAFFETVDVTPRKGIFFPELIKGLVQHCSFQQFPKTIEQWTSNDGAQFETGKLGELTIKKLILFPNGVQIDSIAGTEESRQAIRSILEWARDNFEIAYDENTIKEWGYVSDVTFRSDVPLLMTVPLERLSRSVTTEISKLLKLETVYQPTGITVGHDPLLRKYGRAAFTIQKRAEVPLTDNKYFSEAPLATDVHIELLRQYEKDVAQMLNVR